MPPMNLVEFLTWLATGGGAAVGLAFILERWPKFQSFTVVQKSLGTLLGTTLVALLAYVVLTYVPKEILNQIAPYFMVVAGVVTTWLSSQMGHAVDPLRKVKADKIASPK